MGFNKKDYEPVNIDDESNNNGNDNNGEVPVSQYHEDFHEKNVYGDIDDLLGLDILETCYELPEEHNENEVDSELLRKDNSFYIDGDNNGESPGKVMINSRSNSDAHSGVRRSHSNVSNYSAMNRSYSRHRDSFVRSHSSIRRSFSMTGNPADNAYKVTTIFTEEDYKYLDVIKDHPEEDSANLPGTGTSEDVKGSNNSNNINNNKNNDSNNKNNDKNNDNNNDKNNDNDASNKNNKNNNTNNNNNNNVLIRSNNNSFVMESPIKSELSPTKVNSLSNFFTHFKSKISKKKDNYKSTPELDDDKNYFLYAETNNANGSLKREYSFRKQRSNTLGSIETPHKKSSLSMTKRPSFIEVQRYDGMNSPTRDEFRSAPPYSMSGYDFGFSHLGDNDNTVDIDSVLILADEKEILERNNTEILISPRNKKLEGKSFSNSSFLSHLKRKKDRKSLKDVSCVNSTDILQRKTSFVYSGDLIMPGMSGSVYPSVNTINTISYPNTAHNSNSQIIKNEDLPFSPKTPVKHREDKNTVEPYHLPDYSELLVMSESDIDGLYNTMVKDVNNNNHKKKSKSINNFNNKSGTNIISKKDLKDKDKEFATIIPLKSVEASEISSTPTTPTTIIIPSSQSNRDETVLRSYKVLNDSVHMDSVHDMNSPGLEKRNLSFNAEDENVLVVINPYGIRDIDYSTRRVLPVMNKENCSEDVDDLFNIGNSEKYKPSAVKLEKMESNYDQCKIKSGDLVIETDQPNDIDDLFILSSDLEKKMSVMDSLIVIDDIQENIRPDVTELINLGSEAVLTSHQKLNSNGSSSGANSPNSIGSPKNFFRRISKSFSGSISKINGNTSSVNSPRVIENSPLNGDDHQRVLSPSNLLIIPSYTEVSKGATNNRGEMGYMSPSNDNSCPGSPTCKMAEDDVHKVLNKNLNQEFKNSNTHLRGHYKALSADSDVVNTVYENQMSERTNSSNFISKKPIHVKPLNYFHAISTSLSNDGLFVVRSNDSILDEKNNEERVDYIYYNRDQDKKRTRKNSVIDDFLEFSTVNPDRKKKIVNESTSMTTFKTARSTVKDYYDTAEEEEPVYGSMNMNNSSYYSSYSIAKSMNSNTANYYKQRDRLVASTSINMIKNELYYSDVLQNNHGSLSINNLKNSMNIPMTVQDSVYYDTSQFNREPSVLDYNSNSIYYSAAIAENEEEENERDEEEKEDRNLNATNNNSDYSRRRSKPMNKQLTKMGSNVSNVSNISTISTNNTDLNYYLNMANIMNDEVRRNQMNEITGIPQFTTGYDVGNTYISRMHLASSIDIFSRLEALNRSNSFRRRDLFTSHRVDSGNNTGNEKKVNKHNKYPSLS